MLWVSGITLGYQAGLSLFRSEVIKRKIILKTFTKLYAIRILLLIKSNPALVKFKNEICVFVGNPNT